MENLISGNSILEELGIKDEIISIFPYGSRVYGNTTNISDYDYVIVTKSGILKSGGFKQNAISNKVRTIQGILYSRSGFIDAINNYDITALECLSLPDEIIIKKTWNFKVQKWDDKAFIKSIITKMSASWYQADNYAKDDNFEMAKKGIYHSIRILMFAQQLKENHKIIDFTVANEFKNIIFSIEDNIFDTRDFIKLRDELVLKLKKNLVI